MDKKQETSSQSKETSEEKKSIDLADGFVPGFIASAAALELFFDGYASSQTGLFRFLPFAVFILGWLGYFGATSGPEGSLVDTLIKVGYYKKSILITVISNIAAIAVTIGLYVIVSLAIAHGIITVAEGFIGRFISFGLFVMSLPYITYLAPGLIVALLLRKNGKQRE
jgi:hypothetical protein